MGKNKVLENLEKPKVNKECECVPGMSESVSCSECTGLMYKPAQNQEETESYQELSDTIQAKE